MFLQTDLQTSFNGFTMAAAPLYDPPAEEFRVGDIWESSRGQLYTVFELLAQPGKKRQAVLLAGEDDFKGKRMVRDFDAIGSIESGQFWIRHRFGRPAPVITAEFLQRIADDPTSDFVERANAVTCLELLKTKKLKEAQHIGPFSSVALPSLTGKTVYVKAGSEYRSLHPASKQPSVMSRTKSIKVDKAFRGYVHDGRVVSPEISWAGAGGYWCYACANNIIVPELWRQQHASEAQPEPESTAPRERRG
jgi:hypothetical protein